MTTTAKASRQGDDDKARVVSIEEALQDEYPILDDVGRLLQPGHPDHEALRKPHPWTYDEAEGIVAALLANGYSARSYKRKPAGYEVRVFGTRGGQRFAYTIKTWPEYLDLEGLIARGLTGADKLYLEGE